MFLVKVFFAIGCLQDCCIHSRVTHIHNTDLLLVVFL